MKRILFSAALAMAVAACSGNPDMTGGGGGSASTGGGSGSTGGGSGSTGGGSGATGGGSGATGGGSGATGGGSASTGGGSGATGGGSGATGGGSGAMGGGTATAVDYSGQYVAHLTGSQENPPVDTTATGSGTFTLSDFDGGAYTLTWNITHDAANAQMAHIHNGWAATNGGVAQGFSSATSPIMGSAAVDEAFAQKLATGHTYANVHTTAHSGGEIRGQILHEGETLWWSGMGGNAEIPAVTTTADGGFGIIVHKDGGATYEGTFVGLTATMAHIHKGGPAEPSGAVAQGLTLVANGTAVAGDCPNPFNGAGTDGGFYVNAHTAAHGGGEIRGNLNKNP
jgi:hypothetical protein